MEHDYPKTKESLEFEAKANILMCCVMSTFGFHPSAFKNMQENLTDFKAWCSGKDVYGFGVINPYGYCLDCGTRITAKPTHEDYCDPCFLKDDK